MDRTTTTPGNMAQGLDGARQWTIRSHDGNPTVLRLDPLTPTGQMIFGA